MKASELRIGNYILVESKSEYSISDNGLSIERANIYNIMDLFSDNKDFSYHPIPLTEEWLLDFGFVKGKKYFKAKEYGEEGIFTTMCYNLESKDFIVNSNDYDSYIIECVYVHQLQNLFFALTGEELIKK